MRLWRNNTFRRSWTSWSRCRSLSWISWGGFPYTERTRAQLDVAVEEIFVNIAHYAYPPDQTGWALIRCQVEQDPLRIQVQFVDGGVPFNPLAKKDADITLSAEERNIGGLGILMVKRSMDAADYVYSGGNNILTLTKYL